jgi:hypothetical protein
MKVTLICTGRGTHDPVPIYVVEVPLPDGWAAYPRHSVMDLLCDRAKGGCGRAPRLSNARLRALIEAVADTRSRTFDISFASL